MVAILVLMLAACGQDASPATPAAGVTTASAVADGQEWIALQGVAPGLTIARPGGNGLHVVLDDLPGEQLHPDWSPDGSQLAFVQAADPKNWAVWVSGPDGSNARPLLTKYPVALNGLIWDSPAWSRDGSRIAMVGYAGNPDVELPTRAVLAVVEVGTQKLTIAGDYSFDGPYAGLSFPRWSPDGRQLAVSLGRFGDQDAVTGGAIAIITGTGETWSKPKVITSYDDFADRLDWHPTEPLIVFTTYDIGGYQSTDEASNLYTIRPDGSGRTAVTTFAPGAERATQPTWTSDGRVLFTHVAGPDDTTRSVALINADGTGLRTVLDAEAVGPDNRPHPRMR